MLPNGNCASDEQWTRAAPLFQCQRTHSHFVLKVNMLPRCLQSCSHLICELCMRHRVKKLLSPHHYLVTMPNIGTLANIL